MNHRCIFWLSESLVFSNFITLAVLLSEVILCVGKKVIWWSSLCTVTAPFSTTNVSFPPFVFRTRSSASACVTSRTLVPLICQNNNKKENYNRRGPKACWCVLVRAGACWCVLFPHFFCLPLVFRICAISFACLLFILNYDLLCADQSFLIL